MAKKKPHDPLAGLDRQGVIRKNPDGSVYALQQFDHRYPSGAPNSPIVPLDIEEQDEVTTPNTAQTPEGEEPITNEAPPADDQTQISTEQGNA